MADSRSQARCVARRWQRPSSGLDAPWHDLETRTGRPTISPTPLDELPHRPAEILASLPVPLLVADRDGCCRYANSAAEVLLGTSPGGLSGTLLVDHVTRSDLLNAAYEQALEGGRATLELAARRANGERLLTRWDLVALGRPASGALVVIHDVEADGRAATVATDQARLAGVLAALPMGVYTVDADGRIAQANLAAAHLAGVSLADLPGRRCRDVFPLRDEAGRLLCDWACPRARGAAGPVAGGLRALMPNDDGMRLVDWTCSALQGPSGESLGWIEVVRDVGHTQALDVLRHTLLSAFSHELLTPLAIIKGHAETLRDPATRAEAALADAALIAIDEEVERLRRLVANGLDAARAASGGLNVERAPLALGPLIERAVERFRGRSRRHIIQADVPDAMPAVLGDRERLESVLYNLLDNAVKYSPRGGDIRVRARVHSDIVEVAVEDNGVGLRRADRTRVFEPYYRADPGDRPAVEGSGLGLFISKTIVEAHGGRIWVASRPERGTTVHFTVPRADPAQLPVLAPPPGEAS